MNELAAAAVAYARRGWPVFPCAPRGKVPLTKHGLHDASCDVGLVAARWDESPTANIAIACGPSKLFVVDGDGAEAVRSWCELTRRHGHDRRTLTACTGKGFHLYFRGRGRSSAGRIAPCVDTRGEGGYVIAPPSVHGSGARYRWVDARVAIAPVPAWLLEALDRGQPTGNVGEARELSTGLLYTAYGRRALLALADEVAAALKGERNATLNAASYRAGRLSAAGQIAASLARKSLVAAAGRAGLGEREAVATFESGFQAGLLSPAQIDARA
jgi:Bifunctional DNA primase/polymerase, N-terminal